MPGRLGGGALSDTAPAGSLVVVGTGICCHQHLTPAAEVCIRRAGVLLYLVDSPFAEAHLLSLHPRAVSLAPHFVEGAPRRRAHEGMVEQILRSVRAGHHVCAAFFGHPAVLVDPAHAVVRRAREEGYPAALLPGISAEACLFADLGLDAGANGCQSYEATDFLIRPRAFDIRTALVLWQVGALGEPNARREACPECLTVLAEELHRHYGPDHPAVVYEAATYPLGVPLIRWTTVSALAEAGITARSLLYVPPKGRAPVDPSVVERLAMGSSEEAD